MLSMSASMILLPTASAHTPAWQIPTYAYVCAAPNPDGVGQTVSVYMWLNQLLLWCGLTNNLRFHNYKLTITAPNGAVTTQTFATIIDTTSNQHTSFIPDQVGTYNLTFTYPGETYTQRTITRRISVLQNLTHTQTTLFYPAVHQQQLLFKQTPIPNALAGAPLPTAYWTRPIYGENTDWYTIASNWLGICSPNYGGWTQIAAMLFTEPRR